MRNVSFELSGRDPEQEWSQAGIFRVPDVPTTAWIDQALPVGTRAGNGAVVRMQAWGTESEQTLRWRLAIENRSLSSFRLRWIRLDYSLEWPDGSQGSGAPVQRNQRHISNPEAFEYLHNGWQSWSFTGWLRLDSPIPRTRLGRFTRPMQEGQGFPAWHARKNSAYSEMFTMARDPATGRGFVAGFLSETQAFGRIYLRRTAPALRLEFFNALDDIVLEPRETFVTDWAWLSMLVDDPAQALEAYVQEVGEHNKALVEGSVPVGWCSWYQLYSKVTQSDVQEHAAWAASNGQLLPLDVIQIDDGYEPRVGDWSSRKPSFPDDMAELAGHIRKSGREPGIWLAPFLADRRSVLLKEHPDWVLRQQDGSPVNPGWGWNGFPRVLDITHSAVLEFLAETVTRAVDEWGYGYLKLDFLYAGALPGVYSNPKVTRAQALRTALQGMRAAVGDKVTMLGCGCPLGPGIGIFNAMRIGPDVAPSWKPRLGPLTRWVQQDPGLPSTRNAVRNTISRALLHRRWWINDPDCLLLRESQTNLSDLDVRSLCSAIGLSAGSTFFSDVMMVLPHARVMLGGKLVPPLALDPGAFRIEMQGSIYVLRVNLNGAAGRWTLLGAFNLGDQIESSPLNALLVGKHQSDRIHCIDFWDQSHTIINIEEHDAWLIPPHSVKCVALRPSVAAPQWLGGTLHFSQGQEISSWRRRGEEVHAKVGFVGRELEGSFWAAFPGRLQRAQLGGEDIRFEMIEKGVYSFDATVADIQPLHFTWSTKEG